MVNGQVDEKRKRVESLDESLFEVCGSQDLDEGIGELEVTMSELQESKGASLLLGGWLRSSCNQFLGRQQLKFLFVIKISRDISCFDWFSSPMQFAA